MTEHSTTVGSSTAGRIIACPASYKLSLDIPNTESSYAAEGTMLHSCMEDILGGKYDNDEDCIGFKHGNGHTCTQALFDEMIEPALQAFDDTFPDAEFVTETKVVYPGIPDSFGTADVTGTFVDEDGVTKTLMCDWKFGRGVNVDAVNNKQIAFCAAAGSRTPSTEKFFTENQPIVGVIIQPALGGVSTWEFSTHELYSFRLELENAWINAISDTPNMNDGEHCTFCKAKPTCPVKMDKLKRLAALGELDTHAKSETLPAPAVEMSMKDRLELADIVTDWAKAVKSEAHARLEAGEDISGWKLVAKRATRKWDDEAVAEKFLLGMKATLDERRPRALLSVPQAEKLIKRKSKGRVKALGIRMKTLHSHTVAVSSGTTMAAVDDERAAVSVGSALLKLEELR